MPNPPSPSQEDLSQHGRELTERLSWSAGTWLVPPAAAIPGDTRVDEAGLVVDEAAGDLLVTAAAGSDAWRVTSYGFTRDNAHALLAPLQPGQAMEVEFTADFTQQFDQAGIYLRVSPLEWIKAGTEYADGQLSVGAVVTHTYSDWSLAPVAHWHGRRVTVRASRAGDAVTVRARTDGQDFQLVRVAYLDPAAHVSAGPFVCAPTREGLTVRFHAWRRTPADDSLH